MYVGVRVCIYVYGDNIDWPEMTRPRRDLVGVCVGRLACARVCVCLCGHR